MKIDPAMYARLIEHIAKRIIDVLFYLAIAMIVTKAWVQMKHS